MFDVLLKAAHVVSPHETLVRDVAVSQGKIVKVAEKIDGPAKQEIDCGGRHLLPGCIDAHVHFRDPGFPEKEDFASGSAAAAAGGVTSIIDMPNTDPPTLTLDALEEKRRIAAAKSLVNYGFYIGATTDNLEEIKRAENIAGVKLYMGSSTGNLLVQDDDVIESLLKLGKTVVVHAEDEAIIRAMREKYAGRNAGADTGSALHSLIRPPEAAYEAVRHIAHLAKKHEARVHITHVSTGGELREIQKFKDGQRVTCDATPLHLFLNESAYEERGNYVKVNPPLRSEQDRQALWKGIHERIIDAVATDHAPHTRQEKELPYEKTPAGVPGVETALPLLLDAVNHGQLNLSEVVRLFSEGPALLFNIKNKGRIEEGLDADMTLVDMQHERLVDAKKLFTKCGWSPFAGWRLRGWPVMTIVGGAVVFQNGTMFAVKTARELVFEK